MKTVHDQVMEVMEGFAQTAKAAGMEVEMPPQYLATLGMRVTEVDPGKRLVAEFPFDGRYANPLQFYLGGMTCALMDAVAGPLSYMAAGRPAVSTEFSITFLRPFIAKDEVVAIESALVAKTKSLVVIDITAATKSGKLLAKGRTTSMIVESVQGLMPFT